MTGPFDGAVMPASLRSPCAAVAFPTCPLLSWLAPSSMAPGLRDSRAKPRAALASAMAMPRGSTTVAV